MQRPSVQKIVPDFDDPRAMRAALAAARSALLRQLVGLGAAVLHDQKLWPGTTPVTALARIARRDDDLARTLETLLGRVAHPAPIPIHRVTIDETVPALLAARSRLLSAAAGMVVGDNGNAWSQLASCFQICRDNDRRWARRLEWWNEEQHIRFENGPQVVLLASLKAARKELLTTLALLPPPERPRWQGALISLAAGEEAVLKRQHGDVDPASSWADAWRRFHDTHQALVTYVDGGRLDELDVEVYAAVTRAIDRDREVAFALRKTLPTAAPVPPALRAAGTEPSGPEKTRGLPR
jgi:hypothetical protein